MKFVSSELTPEALTEIFKTSPSIDWRSINRARVFFWEFFREAGFVFCDFADWAKLETEDHSLEMHDLRLALDRFAKHMSKRFVELETLHMPNGDGE